MIFKTKNKYLLGFIILLTIPLFYAFNNIVDKERYDLARQETILRKVGHQILLNAGDSMSRVLPVEKIGQNEYQLKFENAFTFKPDSLVSIIKRVFLDGKQTQNYVVSVLNCNNKAVVFGFTITANEKDDILSCSGRKQPKNCYLINIKFETNSQNNYLIGSVPLLAFIGLLLFRTKKTRKNNTVLAQVHHQNSYLKLGNTLFDTKNKVLINGEITTDLTIKESKLLLIFANSPNILVQRARIQKEIWEDEGVIVGRSLDVFVSRLRKKLENDASIELMNIHSKGYKLTVGKTSS
jgi:DNA-binding winged helix-turn-helix (wHTH) protein